MHEHPAGEREAAPMRVLGVDLAWGEGTAAQVANETGVAALDASGRVVDAGWTIGLEDVQLIVETLGQVLEEWG